VSAAVEDLVEVRALCPAAAFVDEGGARFIDLPGLKIQSGQEVIVRNALLSLQAHSGYTSRLYISAPIPGKGINWTVHTVLGRAWHTPSWQGVPPGRAIEMVQQHLKVYQ
jgi:hypothetical protein